ncbi:YgfZ/GcvT domain-containing protein [Cerasicoccus maritimus]|uniref:CAF17-like 4Fe-4S cluster assembly/insertion protein YgfZ n=1 Tax=Cerasicoccus maritimus TaxID=490089 RepID=UPI002852881B|nr:hypothetical protein [Cerasicoccus maritimus]
MSALQAYTSQPAILAVSDEDAAAYLQSQFSNDLRRSESCPATYGLFLDRKGKVLHDAFILQRGPEDFLLISYHSDAETLQCKVEENIIADEVEIEDVSAQFRLVTLFGDDLSSELLPPDKCFIEQDGVLIFRGRLAGTDSLDCLVPQSAEWPPAHLNATFVDAESALAARISCGTPSIPQDIGEKDLPHEGADLSKAAVSYTKGCYLGQEVMARLHAMGHAQRAIYRIHFASQSNHSTPIPVFAGEKEIGSVTSHVGGNGLALLKRRYTTGDAALCIAKPGGPTLEIISEITA